MLYCDYDTYTGKGGTMSAAQYGVWGARASRRIDRLTLGRAALHAEELAEELADACCQLADALLRQSAARQASAGGLLASASNDGYSESYATPDSAGRAAGREAYAILADALGDDPCGLLYRGCC